MQSVDKIVDSLRQVSRMVTATANSYEYPEADITELMNLLYELGRRSHLDADFSRAVANSGVVMSVGDELRGVQKWIERYANDLYAFLEDHWDAYFALDNWREACIRRSALEFACEFFADTVYANLLPELSLAEVDDSLRAKEDFAGGIPDQEIPDGIPRTHWWWWSPLLDFM